MKNFEEILSYFKKEDILQNSILDKHYTKENGSIDSLKIYSLVNRIIQNLNNDLILVLPAKKEIAYLSSIFAALTFYKNNFQDRLNNFDEWLQPNNNVMLCSSGDQTGKIYKYLGKKNDNFITLGSIVDKSIKIDHKIDTLLQLAPIYTDNISEKNIGKKGFIPKPHVSLLDKVLNLKSYNNPLLYRNNIILLTNFYSNFSNFLNTEIIFSNPQHPIDQNLASLITTGQIDDKGSITQFGSKTDQANIKSLSSLKKDIKIEPLVVYTRDLGPLYEYAKENNESKLIICDDVRKLNLTYPIYDQVKDANPKYKFLILAEESEYEDVIEFSKKNNSKIWKLTNTEINNYISNVSTSKLDNNSTSYLYKSYEKNKNHVFKKDFYLEIDDNDFNKIDLKFKNIYRIVFKLDEIKKERIIELLRPLRTRMYQLRDHIFGFPDILIEDTKQNIEEYFLELNSIQSNIENSLYDDLIELGNFFKDLDFYSSNLFSRRLMELHENIKIREKDSKGNYAIYAYNLARKNYYQENIKKKWNIDVDVIYSIDTSKIFKNLIVPSELVSSKILKLLLNDNFENIYFIGSKSLKEEMNNVKSNLISRWSKYNISNENKCEITNLNKSYSNAFFTPEEMQNYAIEKDTQNIINYEELFLSKDFSKYRTAKLDEEVTKVPAFLTIFNGDCYSFFTEGFSTNVYNSIFDPSAFDKKKIVKKNWRTLQFGDIILLRNETDSDVLDQEAISICKDEKLYFKYKQDTKKIPKILNQSIGNNRDILKILLRKVNYDKGLGNVFLLADVDGGIICPNSYDDLKKIFLACSMINKYDQLSPNGYNYVFDEKEVEEIFRSAKAYKSLRLSAGFAISKKLDEGIRSNIEKIEFDGNPLRVDFINGNVIFGSDTNGIPEGYIVQVNNYEEPRSLKDERQSLTNRLIFL